LISAGIRQHPFIGGKGKEQVASCRLQVVNRKVCRYKHQPIIKLPS